MSNGAGAGMSPMPRGGIVLGDGPVIPCPSGVVPPETDRPLAGVHVMVVGRAPDGTLELKNCALCGGYGLVQLHSRVKLRELIFGPAPRG